MIIQRQPGATRFVLLPLCFAIAVLVLSLCQLCRPVKAGEIPSLPKKTIAMLSDGPSEPQNDLTLRFQKAVEILAEGEITPVFKKRPAYSAQWQNKKAMNALQTTLNDPE